jgi:hypothetical protein
MGSTSVPLDDCGAASYGVQINAIRSTADNGVILDCWATELGIYRGSTIHDSI